MSERNRSERPQAQRSTGGHPGAAPVPTVDARTLEAVGAGLHEPECVLATAAGDVYVSDLRGGVTRIRPDGTCTLRVGHSRDLSEPLHPNGIALDADGSFLVAHLGSETGGVFRLAADGALTPVVRQADGVELPPTNFVLLEAPGRLWITVSTRKRPRTLGYRPDAGDGFIVLSDARGARIVADGLGYTNEARIDPSCEWLYVNETFGRRLTRFRIGRDGRLSGRQTVAEFGAGIFLDGLAFDRAGCAWVTSVVSNRLIRIAPDGGRQIVLEDADADHVAWVEVAFQAGRADRAHLGKQLPGRLPNLSSIAFGGPQLRHVYLGCFGDRIYRFAGAVPGVPPVHWTYHSNF